ncbi:MAG: hypothetical protein CL610_21220 [Anaerolineaceae bacterium]|nr:hypothetical protein [Anaerolineaceae bacterium]
MPITHQWDDDAATIYRIELAGEDWTWPQFSAAVRQVYDYLGETGRIVHVIMWFQGPLPPGDALSNLRAGGMQPSNIRHTVLVNDAGRFLEALIDSVVRVRGWDGPKFVKSLDDARDRVAALIAQDERDGSG